MNEDKIKKAFVKAKQDIFNLSAQLELIKREIRELKIIIQQTSRQTVSPTQYHIGNSANHPKEKLENQAENQEKTAFQQIKPTKSKDPTDIPVYNLPLKALKTLNLNTSIGNNRVPTDRQTDRQTDNSTGDNGIKVRLNNNPIYFTADLNNLTDVSTVINSLDNLKKELRQKFKKLTKQEMLIFSTIYQLEDEGFSVNYSLISKKLNLTESSIRDYVQRLFKKGIPLQKTKENNKKIILSIPQELKKIASLDTILQLRDL